MKIVLFIIIGLSGGLFGGMGMGGGTLLIPLLTLFCGVPQHVAQCVNLVAFVPMSLVALFIHIKNKLIKPVYLLTISLPALILSVLGAYVTSGLDGRSLSRYFGIFLALLGLYQLVMLIVSKVGEVKQKKINAALSREICRLERAEPSVFIPKTETAEDVIVKEPDKK